MTEALAVFASSFVSVFALGFQSLNVNQGRYLWASLTSLTICTGSLFLFKALPNAGVISWEAGAYYLGCNLGILASIWLHPRLKSWWDAGSPTPLRNKALLTKVESSYGTDQARELNLRWPTSQVFRPACNTCGMPEGVGCPRLVCERYDEHADPARSLRLH